MKLKVKLTLFEFLSSHLQFGLCDFAISLDLDEGDIELLKTYGQGQYHKSIKTIEDDIQKAIKQVNELTGIKESDTGLAPPALWDLAADKQTLQNEQPLQVARCTKIINADTDDPKYIINVKQFAKFVVDLADSVAPTDIEEGMRVGVDRNKYQIHIPLPPKIDPTVTMMQVEDKPDVTYSDVGGCKEQIEKLREVVETPLLHVSLACEDKRRFNDILFDFSLKNSSHSVLNHQKVFCSSVQ